MTTTLATLSQLRDASRLCWEMAVETAESDRQSPAEAAMESALGSWDAAINAVEDGQIATAILEMEHARRIAREWGDDAQERDALDLLRAQRGEDRR